MSTIYICIYIMDTHYYIYLYVDAYNIHNMHNIHNICYMYVCVYMHVCVCVRIYIF